MTHRNGRTDEMWPLLEALCEDRLTPEEAARLETIALHDAEARWLYITYLDLHGTLHWDTAIGAEESPVATEVALLPEGSLQIDPARHLQPVQNPGARVPVPQRQHKRALAVFASACACLIAVLLGGLWSAGAWKGDVPVVEADPVENPAPQQPERMDPEAVAAVQRKVETPPRREPLRLEAVAPRVAESDPQPAKAIEPLSDPIVSAPVPPGSSGSVVSLIDEHIRAGWERAGVVPSSRAEDSEWVRRAYLDIVGHTPPADVVERFLADSNRGKRSELIERLLDDPGYVRNLTTVWTNLLVGRSMERDVNRPALQKFLRMSFAGNRSWDAVVAELVAAEGDFEQQGATNFLLAHLNNEAVPATAIVSRVFLGMQLQCMQCHKHPVSGWEQARFWEFNSFFQQTEVVREYEYDPQTGRREFARAVLRNREVGGPTHYETRNGLVRVAYPRFEGIDVDDTPSTNRRQALAELMTRGEKPQMAEATVNRLWSHFFGHGFTRPVDDMGPHNPPSHPELLDLLARRFVASGYDVKQLIRWICNSEPYQLSSRFGPHNEIDDPAAGEPLLFSRVYVKSMTAEQLYDSLLVATNAHQGGRTDWTQAEAQRQEWLQQFIIAFETEENDEANTFNGTLPQALMMMNGELIEAALSAAPGTYLSDLLREELNETERIRRLFLASLSREPSPRELTLVRKLLRERTAPRPGADRRTALVEAYQDVFWACLNSNEFILIP